MKSVIVTIAAVLMVGSFAQADGFICESESGLNVKIFNNTHAKDGTRSAAAMVISDSAVGHGNKTIAKFSSVKQTLSSKSQTYFANVDLRMSELSRKGENIAGTKLGELDTIVAMVDFSYGHDLLSNGDEVQGTLTFTKRNGDEIVEGMVCERYLKN